MKGVTIERDVDVWVRQEYLGRATLRDRFQHLRLRQLVDRLRGQDHGRILLAPGLLRPRHIVANGLIANEHPGLVHDEDLELGAAFRGLDLRAGAMEDVEQQRLQHVRVARHAIEVEGLEGAESQRVLSVVEDMPKLTGARPALEPLTEWPDNGSKTGERAAGGVELVDPLDSSVQAPLLGAVELIFAGAFDQHAQEG